VAIETINGTLQLTRLTNESAEYVARRKEFLEHNLRLNLIRDRHPDGLGKRITAASTWFKEKRSCLATRKL
jgi:hypothetical protein